MKYRVLKSLSALVMLTICATSIYAESTPPLILISQESAQNMPVNTTQTLTYTVKSNVPAPVLLNMATDRTMLSPGTPLVNAVITNNCQSAGMANYVPPLGQCNVSVRLTAGAAAGRVTQNLLINYGPTFQTIAPAPAIVFDVTSGSSGSLMFTVAPTGNSMLTNSSQTLIWTLSNTTSSAITLVPTGINFTIASNLISPPSFTNDCSDVVPASGTCNIQTTINSLSTPGNVSQYLAVTYNTSSTLVVDTPTNFNITAAPTSARTFTFENKCPYKVWLAFSGGGQGNLGGCTSDADCDQASGVPGAFACNPNANAGAGLCSWRNPAPANGVYELAELTGSNSVTLSEYVYSPTPTQPIVWSGVITGRTGCTSSGCETADCGGGTGACPTGQGIIQPAVQPEITLQTNNDFYDLTTINGLNVPMSIAPSNASLDPVNPYTCGATGIGSDQTASAGTIGGCSWSFTPPSNNYIWVADAGSNTCTLNSDCDQAQGEACGLKRSSILGNTGQTMCGKFLGYWTADQVCIINSTYAPAPFTCNASADGGANFAGMYGCNQGPYAVSCYTNPNVTACCGCHDWQNAPTNLILPSDNNIVQQCNGSNNPTWFSNALPTLGWYKAACPPAYVYPYDDKSSSFTCSNSATQNSVNYHVTYCPDGHSGAPPGTIQS